jgi:hypothetical protein
MGGLPSSESGRVEAYVTSFPDANGKWLISSDGAHAVRWFPNGQALLYEKMDGNIVKVPFLAHGSNAEIGAAQLYVNARPRATTNRNGWDVARHRQHRYYGTDPRHQRRGELDRRATKIS